MPTTRREFIAMTGAALAAARSYGQSANERLGVAWIGCGNRGNSLLNDCMKLREQFNVDCVALCDVWRKNLLETADKVERGTGTRPKTFTRYAEVLALPEVDAVVIATPDFAHSPILAAAAEAKKHAYCEKPMAVRIEDARRAVDAVEANGIVCQVGTQFRSDGRHRASAKLIQSGVLGTLIKAQANYHDNRPRWQREYDDVKAEDVDWEQFCMYWPETPFDARKFRLWHLYEDCCNGLIGLLGVHPIDVAVWYTDDPLPLSCVGMGEKRVWTDREHLDMQECLFTYPKGHIMQFSSWLGNSPEVPQNAFYGTRGVFDTKEWTARGDGGGEGKIEAPIGIEAEESAGHMANWLECIRENNRKTHADVHAGYAHSVASIMGMTACKTGMCVRYDHAAREIKAS